MKRFKHRSDAGQQLAVSLKEYKNQANTIVLALPRGGVPVAYEIAVALHLPLNVFLVRKLGVPGNEEVAMGAIAEENICFLNEALINQLDIEKDQIQVILNKERKELSRRLERYRQGKTLTDLKNKIVILVDDGIATGATSKAAISALRTLKPAAIILAIPVASHDSLHELASLVDKCICVLTPEPFYGVGMGYEIFPQTSDEEVLALLQDARKQLGETS